MTAGTPKQMKRVVRCLLALCVLAHSTRADGPDCEAMLPEAWEEPLSFPPSSCTSPGLPSQIECSDDGCVIDLFVVYTPAARQAAGGSGIIESRIDDFAASTNIAFQNSGISARVRVVAAHEVSYTEPSPPEPGTMSQNFRCLKAHRDQCIDDVHDDRNLFLADVVVLIMENPGLVDGQAGVSIVNGYAHPTNAFAVVRRSVADADGSWTFAHELVPFPLPEFRARERAHQGSGPLSAASVASSRHENALGT